MRRPLLLQVALAQELQDFVAARELAVAGGFDGIEGDLRTCGDLLGEQPSTAPIAIRLDTIATRIRACELDLAAPRLENALNTAASFGAVALNVEIQPAQRDATGGVRSVYQETLNFGFLLLQAARHEAEACGVALGIEGCAHGMFLSPVEMWEIIDRANSWAVGACVDVERVSRIGSALDWIATLRHRVHSVRLSAAGFERIARAEASDPDPLVTCLDEVGYEGPIIVTGLAPNAFQHGEAADPRVASALAALRGR